MKTSIYAGTAIALTLFLAGCGGSTSDPSASVDSKQATTLTENMLGAVDVDNYSEFSRDFRPELKQALTEQNFEDLRARLSKSSGRWLSVDDARPVPHAAPYRQYQMKAAFERENVDVWIWFEPPNERILGVMLDSPGLQAYEPDEHGS